MNDIKDLHLTTEILPLFDHTLNDFTKSRLYELFQEPLSSIADIEIRQDILKGFIANHDIFHHYSYARLDFKEVYQFFNDSSFQTKLHNAKWRIVLLKKERHKTAAKFIQFILLFHKLEVFYLKRINTRLFPETYKEELRSLNHFIASFRLNTYEELIRTSLFKTKHMFVLAKLIAAKQQNGEIERFYNRLFLFESFLSISKCMVKHKFCFPSISNHLLVENFYHPLLSNPVKNSFSSDKNVILLTGPNMSGKSTFLKSVGLCVYLAHLGIGVPADKFELPFFQHISIAIHHNDDLSKGYSHFMLEITRLKQVLLAASADQHGFAVFDELFKGTNMEDAVQISATTINGLTKFKKSYFFISTHLLQLKDLELVHSKQVDSYYVDASVENDEPVFNYQIRKGWSDLKLGQLLFNKEGLHELLQTRYRT